jgi:hypothetical protein
VSVFSASCVVWASLCSALPAGSFRALKLPLASGAQVSLRLFQSTKALLRTAQVSVPPQPGGFANPTNGTDTVPLATSALTSLQKNELIAIYTLTDGQTVSFCTMSMAMSADAVTRHVAGDGMCAGVPLPSVQLQIDREVTQLSSWALFFPPALSAHE